ncbi:MAG: hypothetical protein KatS3mg076_3247 [Candidatus Binatia bacterium]|nr:MAG: hypothetical protein KatS3mg076_3247 [Candidatus Binatia bacterium]
MRRPVLFTEEGENRCFGCGPANPVGLKLSFFETAEGVEAEYVAPPELEGAPGVVHGGIQATLLDEVLCMTAYAKLGKPVLTGELTIRYLVPTPSGTRLRIRGRVAEVRGRSALLEGWIETAADGVERTRARGRFFAQEGTFSPEASTARQD